MSSKKTNRILLDSGTNEVEFLRVSVGNQVYGFNVAKVRQVIVFERQKVCFLPELPNHLLGNLDYRGKIIPVIDIGAYFSVPPVEVDTPPLLLIIELNKSTMGLVVQKVHKIIRCSWTQFVPADQSLPFVRHDAVVGTVIVGDELTPILDVESLLNDFVPSASLQAAAEEVCKQQVADEKQLKVLYCEDSATVRAFFLSSMRSRGYKNVSVYETGAEALDALRVAKPGQFDVIVSDIEMPIMDGLTLCKELRGMSSWQDTPVLFFSSTVNEEMRRKCMHVGATASFSKPEIDRLISELDSFC